MSHVPPRKAPNVTQWSREYVTPRAVDTLPVAARRLQGWWPDCVMPPATDGEGSNTMGFYEVLGQVVALLRQQGRVTYRALKHAFQLDDAYLEDLKDEIIKARRLAVDE